MELNLEQKAAVGRWVEEGASLSEVQRRIRDEFGMHLTYMEVRFLVLDIGAEVKDRAAAPEAKTEAPAEAPGAGREMPDAAELDAATEAPDAAMPDAGQEMPGAAAPDAGAGVSVELDKVMRAGAMLSGSVTFSDGVTGNWMLDRFGRLALTKVSQPGYQPKPADLEAFQIKLQSLIGGY